MLSEEFASHYCLKKIIFINSASHAYTELALDRHLAMFGKNNLGKTASLSATKLLLYPESNFNNCELKFNFVSKSGKKFKKQESYEYYFPTPQSFLIMEAQNPAGSFCMILYKTNNYQYQRCLLPVSYDEVRDLFWDETTNNFADTLSVATIHQAVKQFKGKEISDKKEMSEILFANYSSSTSRYCLVPLKDKSEAAINAFRGIYELAFNAGKGEETALPEAIATIIEMNRGRSEERLDADFTTLQTDYDKLLQETQTLKKYKNNQPIYESLKTTFDNLLTDFQDYSLESAVLKNLIIQLQTQKTEQSEDLSQNIKTLISQEYPLKVHVESLRDNEIKLQERQQQTQQAIKQHDSEIQQIKTLASQYSGKVEIAIHQLTKRLEDVKQYLQSLDDLTQLQENLKQASNSKSSLDKQIELLKHAQDNRNALMLSRLSAHSASILQSINTDFANITAELSQSEIAIIQAFTDLFTNHYDNVLFKEQTLSSIHFNPYNSEQMQQQIAQSLEQKTQEQNDLSQKINTFQKLISQANSEMTVDVEKNKLQQEQATLKKDLDLLGSYDYIQSKLIEKQTELDITNQQLNQNQTDFEKANAEHLAVLQQLNAKKTELDDIKKQLSQFEHKTAFIQRAESQLPPNYIATDSTQYEQKLAAYQQDEPNYEIFENLEKQAQKLKDEKLDFQHELKSFMEKLPLDSIDIHKELNNFSEYGQIINQYQNVFSSLIFREQTHENNIRTHNQYLSSMIKEIQNAHNLLKSNIDKMNAELKQHRISNFESVRLRLITHADFETLLNDCLKYDEHQNSLMESTFYTRLIDYIKNNSTSQRKLKLVNLIKSINYEYIYSSGDIETKAQSGGTTSTVTAFIISMLLKEILFGDYQFKMPVIVDEIADIDKDNIETIVTQISKAGFAIFCATPHRITPVCKSVGNHIDIDYCKFDQPLISSKCVLHILPKHINTFGKKHES